MEFVDERYTRGLTARDDIADINSEIEDKLKENDGVITEDITKLYVKRLNASLWLQTR